MSDYFNRKELIYTIYTERSFSRAAQKLFISQPSLSTMVHRLEEELGFPLFDRTSKPISMTEPGMEYIRAAEEILHIEKGFENYADSYKNLQTGTLTVGSNQLFSSLVLPKYISEFVGRYPKISLHLVDDNSVVLENQILTGQLDLVIDSPELNPDIFDQRLLITENLLLAVPMAFECNSSLADCRMSYEDILAGKYLRRETPAAPLKAFAEAPFVSMTKNNDTRIRFDKILRQNRLKYNSVLEIDRLATAFRFAEMGNAATLVSDTLIKHLSHRCDNVWFYKIKSPLAKREIYVSYKKNKYYSKAMESFTELLFEMLEKDKHR